VHTSILPPGMSCPVRDQGTPRLSGSRARSPGEPPCEPRAAPFESALRHHHRARI